MSRHMKVATATAIVSSLLGALLGAGCKDEVGPAAPITVTAVSPATDLLGGGTSVTITGTNFIDVTSVTIGGSVLGSRTVVSTTEITGTAPAAANAGPVDVVVTSSSHGSGTCRGCFRYMSLGLQTQALAAGADHTCALASDSTTYCWGNTNGPTPVAVSAGLIFRAVVAGGYETTAPAHTCGLTSDGAAYCWGNDGNLGNDSTSSSSTPVAVSGGLSFRVLVAFEIQTCGLTSAGAAYCWGDPENDQSFASTPSPYAVGLRFIALAAGGAHDCGLTLGGEAYCWGLNSDGQLGNGSTANSFIPVAVSGGLSFIALAAGGAHTCGLTPGGEAYCWGRNASGQLGIGTAGPETCGSAPCSTVPVPVATSLRWTSITGGVGRTCGLTPGGEAYCWGFNSDGQLGNGSTANSFIPVAVSGGLSFIALAAGGRHACGRTTSGEVYCWGLNGSGQLGDGTTTSSTVPVAVIGLPGATASSTAGVRPPTWR